jgi:hypothetical protein
MLMVKNKHESVVRSEIMDGEEYWLDIIGTIQNTFSELSNEKASLTAAKLLSRCKETCPNLYVSLQETLINCMVFIKYKLKDQI